MHHYWMAHQGRLTCCRLVGILLALLLLPVTSLCVTPLAPSALCRAAGPSSQTLTAVPCPLLTPLPLFQAQAELRSREEALRPQVARLEAELELQHDLVTARMPTDVLRRVGFLEVALQERRAQLRSLQQRPQAEAGLLVRSRLLTASTPVPPRAARSIQDDDDDDDDDADGAAHAALRLLLLLLCVAG